MFLKKMTDEQRHSAVLESLGKVLEAHSAVLKSLGEVLNAQREMINVQEYRISGLVKKLETAEKKLKEIESLYCNMNAVKEGGVSNG